MQILVKEAPWKEWPARQVLEKEFRILPGEALKGLTLKVSEHEASPIAGYYPVSLSEIRETLAQSGRDRQDIQDALTFFQDEEAVNRAIKLTPKGNLAIPAFACEIVS